MGKQKPKMPETKMGRALKSAERRAAPSNAYEKLLGMTDASNLRKTEKELAARDTDGARCLHFFFAGDLNDFDGPMANVTQSVDMAKDNPALLTDMIACTLTDFIYTVLSDPEDSFTESAMVDALNEICGAFPEEFQNNDAEEVLYGLTFRPFANPMENGLYAGIRWSEIFRKDSVPGDWCVQIMKLLKGMINEEAWAELNKKADTAMEEAAAWLTSRLPEIEQRSQRSMQKIGIAPQTTGPRKSSAPLSDTAIKQAMASLEHTRTVPYASLRKPAEIALDLQKAGLPPAPDWLMPMSIIEYMQGYSEIHRFYAHMMAECGAYPTAFAAFRAYSASYKAGIRPPIAENLLMMFMIPRAVDPVTTDMIELKEDRNIVEFDAMKQIIPPDEWQKERRKHQKKLASEHPEEYGKNDIMSPSLSIHQIFTQIAGTQPPEFLRISTDERDLLESLGMEENMASLLGGYMAGVSEAGRSNLLVTGLLHDDTETDEDEEETPEEEPVIQKEDPDAAVKERYEAIIRESGMQLDAEKKRSEKYAKSMRHELAEAERKNTALEDENSRLKDEIAFLKEEVEMLRAALPAEPENDDPKESEKYEWPFEPASRLKIIVVGGTPNWVAQLKLRFPEAKFCGTDTIPNERAVMDCDFLFVNWKVIDHAHWWPTRNAADKAGIPQVMFPTSGINTCAVLMADTIMEAENGQKTETDG